MFALMPWRKRTTAPLPRTELPFGWIPEEFARSFNRLFTLLPFEETPELTYPWGFTMEEKEKEIVVRAELPGFAPEEVKVELLGGRLLIEAEHKELVEKGKEKEKEEKPERTHVHVKREMTLPPEVELEKAVAVYRHGVLEVAIPRKPEAVARRIEVKV
jgi:HSP20 family protein